jgi:hypothetical protein
LRAPVRRSRSALVSAPAHFGGPEFTRKYSSGGELFCCPHARSALEGWEDGCDGRCCRVSGRMGRWCVYGGGFVCYRPTLNVGARLILHALSLPSTKHPVKGKISKCSREKINEGNSPQETGRKREREA